MVVFDNIMNVYRYKIKHAIMLRQNKVDCHQKTYFYRRKIWIPSKIDDRRNTVSLVFNKDKYNENLQKMF